MNLKLLKILNLVSKFYKIPIECLQGKSRKKEIVHARQVYMFLSRKYTSLPLFQIADICNRDHATVLHAVKVINDKIYIYREIMAEIKEIEQNLTNPLVVQDVDLLQLSKNHTLSYVG